MLWPGRTDALRSLEIVHGVRNVHIWVRVIHEIVEHLNDFLDAVLAMVQPEPLLVLTLDEGVGHLGVLLAVVLLHHVLTRARLVVAELVAEHVRAANARAL